MGEDLIVHGAEEIVSRLISFAFDEIGLLVGVKRDAQSLQASLNSIHATLQDAEEKQVKEKPIRVWLEELKQVAYDVEDVFDEIAYEQLRRSILINNKGCYYYISSSFITRFALRFQFAHQIKAINLRLADIDNRKRRFNLQPTDDQNNPAAGIDRETTSFVDDSDVVGREDDKENIVRMLINQHTTSVVAIYGLGGLGKTTLAQLAYNDDAVLKHFDLRVWICVSDHFDTTRLFTQILEQIPDTTKPQSSTKQVLENALKEQLKGKKFLLVLDDVWTEQQEKWEDFAPPLKKFGAAGSKIIVTCRSQNVVMTVAGADQDSRYELKGLSKDDCWTLIQQRAFRPGGLTWNPEQIGKEISNKCKGVPLAAKMLGSLLQSKKEEWEWLAVQNAEIWNLPNLDVGENRIMEVLKLSYDDLSPALKSCFSFCAIFPKDYWISRELLIKLWMAQGLLGTTSSTIEESDMEDKGKAYFNRLYSKSFFQEAKMDKFGEVSRCKMHDHVQDLAQFICEYECQIMGESNKNSVDLSKCRHASLISQTLVETLKVAKKVRTIICFEGTLLMTRASTFFNFTLLRVLDLSHSECCNFPFFSHCKLKHLRYLDLSYTNIKSLPSWVTWLYNLQTLKLIKCGKLTELPEDLMNLKKLRHLHIDEYRKWKKMPQAIGELHQLQTLPIFVACEEYAGRGITALKNLNNLGGTLDIHCLCRVKEASLAKGANILSEKRNLRELRLHWDRPSSVGDEGDDSLILEERPSVGDEGVSEERSCIGGGDGDDIPVLEVLRPHTNLQRLSIKGFGGVKFPAWVSSGSDLPNLVKMKLNNCNHCEHIPSFGGLHRLKKLELRSMAKLKEWLEGDGVMFPCLEELSIEDCPNLIKTTEHLFPSLKSLALENVGGIGVVSITSSLTSLTSLTITKCKDLEYLQEGLVSNNSQLNVVLISNCPILKAFEEEASTADEILPNRFLCELVIDESGISYAREGILRISKCPELESIGKGFLSSLIFLESVQVDGDGCCKLKRIELSQSLKYLRELHIDGCCNFEGFSHHSYCPAISSIDFQSFASLRELRITYCRGLQALQGLPFLTALQELTIYECPAISSIDFQSFASLRELRITNCRGLQALQGLPFLTALQELEIHECAAISSIDLPNLPSLRELTVNLCGKLQVLQGFQFLTALQELLLGPFSEELNDFPLTISANDDDASSLQSNNLLILPCLRKLWIHGWDALQSLPHQLQRLTTLKFLWIENFSNLTVVPEWLGNLTSLDKLSIRECKNLSHLPSKEQMQRLILLQELYINSCPGLKESCSRDGEEWPKISHIPQIRIDWAWQHI